MKGNLSSIVVESVFDLTGYRPSTKEEIVKYLKSYLNQKGVGEFIVDNDITTLFELCSVWADFQLNPELYDAIKFQSKLSFRRIGRKLMTESEGDKKVIDELIVSSVLTYFPYLKVSYSKGSVSFIENSNTVLRCNLIMHVESLGREISFLVYLPRIHDMYTLKHVVSKKFLGEPFKWEFNGKQKRCEGRWVTSEQLIDLLSNKGVLALENNVKFKEASKK